MVQLRLVDEVAQLEGRLVHPGVLVVDEAQLAAVVEDVGRQQVVVAGHAAAPGRLPSAASTARGGRRQRVVPLGHGIPPLADDAPVAALDLEHVEARGERRSGVQAAQGRGRAAARLAATSRAS